MYDSEALKEWAGQRSGPIAMYKDEGPRAGWAEIPPLTERLRSERLRCYRRTKPTAPLRWAWPANFGEEGLGWSRRLQLIHADLQRQAGGFPERVSKYLGKKIRL